MARLASLRTVVFSLATSALLLIAVVLLSGGKLGAQQDDARTVRVVVSGPQDRPELDVVPRSKTICRSPRTDCAGEVMWVMAGQPLEADEVVELVPKEGVEPCFSSTSFSLSASSPTTVSGQATCGPGSSWDYDAVLLRGGVEIVRLDPRVVIDP